jgi:hypothetical protein
MEQSCPKKGMQKIARRNPNGREERSGTIEKDRDARTSDSLIL